MYAFMGMLKPFRSHRQTVFATAVAALSLTGLNSVAHAQDGWLFAPYLRADLGYSSTVDDDADSNDDGASALNIVADQSARYQIGAGMELTPYLRSDITVSYRGDMAEADTFHSFDDGDNYPAAKGSFKTSNVTAMLNVYIDPLTASGVNTGRFSPYLQGGIGWAHNRTKFVNLSTINTNISGGENNDLAWQVGAGLNYSLTDQWKIDVSYRYISMGEAHGGSTYQNGGTSSAFDRDPRFDLQAHEVLLGLQYQF